MDSETTLTASGGEPVPGDGIPGALELTQAAGDTSGAATVAGELEGAALEPQEPPALTADHALLAWHENFVRSDSDLTRDTSAWNEIGASMARIRAAIASAKGVK